MLRLGGSYLADKPLLGYPNTSLGSFKAPQSQNHTHISNQCEATILQKFLKFFKNSKISIFLFLTNYHHNRGNGCCSTVRPLKLPRFPL